MGDYVDSNGVGRNFTPEQLGRLSQQKCNNWPCQLPAGHSEMCSSADYRPSALAIGIALHQAIEEELAWQQLQRVHDYLQQQVDLAYLRLYHNGESAGLYEEWQRAGDAMWLVRDTLKGREPLVGTRTITSVDNMLARESGKEEQA